MAEQIKFKFIQQLSSPSWLLKKKKDREKALQTWQQPALWSKPLLRWEHLNATLRGDCCLFQIKWFTNENTTHKITGITQSPLCRWFTAHMTDRGTCRFKCHPLSFFFFFQRNLALTSQNDKEMYLKSSGWCVWSLYIETTHSSDWGTSGKSAKGLKC